MQQFYWHDTGITVVMARAYVPQTSFYPYHVTGRSPNRENFRIPIHYMWQIMEDYLYYLHHVYKLNIYSFVLMPNHFHLICSIVDKKIGEVIQEFMWKTSKEINALSGRINQNWGGRHFKCVISDERHFLNVYKYVYQNPVRAKLCLNVEDWKFSTLNGILGKSKLIIPLREDKFLFNPDFSVNNLIWLNREIEESDLTSMRIALKKREFRLPKNQFKRVNPLETKLI